MDVKLRDCDVRLLVGLFGEKYYPGLEIPKREMEIFTSDGYGDPANRSWFFCVKGSHNKLCGFVRLGVLQTDGAFLFETSKGKFYGFGTKVSKRNFSRR